MSTRTLSTYLYTVRRYAMDPYEAPKRDRIGKIDSWLAGDLYRTYLASDFLIGQLFDIVLPWTKLAFSGHCDVHTLDSIEN